VRFRAVRHEVGEDRHGAGQHEPRHVRASREERHCRPEEPDGVAPLLAREPRRHERPQLVQPPRARDQDAQEQRDLDLHVQGAREPREVEADVLARLGRGVEQGTLEGLEDRCVAEPPDDGTDHEAEGREHDTLAQLAQVREQGHPPLGVGAA